MTGGSAGVDYGEWERSADAAVVALAEDAKSGSLDDQIELLHGSDVEATAAGISYPRLTPRLAQLLAESNTEPLTWADALVRRGASPDLLLPFLQQSVEADAEGWRDVLADLLGNDSYSWVAAQVALTHPVGEELRTQGIAGLTGGHKSLTESLLARGDVDAETVERLLDAPDPIVARDAAIAITHTSAEVQVSSLSEAGQARWREVIIASPADELLVCRAPEGRPRSLRRNGLATGLSDCGATPTEHWLLPHTLKEGIAVLPLRIRQQLIDAIPADAPSFPLQDVVTELVGSDLRRSRGATRSD